MDIGHEGLESRSPLLYVVCRSGELEGSVLLLCLLHLTLFCLWCCNRRRAAGHDDLGSPSITIRPLWPEKGHWTRKAPTMDTVEQALRTAHSPGAPEGLRRQALEVRGTDTR